MEIDNILIRYGELLGKIDAWYGRCQSQYMDEIRCIGGCSECCRGLFDITLLDAFYLQKGFEILPAELRQKAISKAIDRLNHLKLLWPELSPPYVLNVRPEDEWEILMPDDDETACVLLGDDGRCMVYAQRPMTCRLYGLPLLDSGGAILHDEWCTKNFENISPLQIEGLADSFARYFEQEVMLFRELELALCGQGFRELDTLIPLALLVDYRLFDWKEWGRSVALVNNL